MDIAIVGVGKLGVKVCEALSEGNHSITLMDMNSDLLDRLSQQYDVMTINEDGRDIAMLKEMNIGSFDYVIAVSGSDETNMIVGRFAKAMGAKCVIARVRDPEYMMHFDFIRNSMGIDYLVNPDFSITMEIYKYLVDKYSIDGGIFTSGKIGLIEFNSGKKPELIGKTMPEVRNMLPNMLVAAISRSGKIIIPHGTDSIQEGDDIYMVGEKIEIVDMDRRVREKGRHGKVQKVMIIGGGKTGFYLAQKLADYGARVKLVEQSKERCQYLSTRVKNVMIINGDGTDIDMLEEENMDEMDAFVTATGIDEQNLLLALTAKQRGIEDVISKVSREDYLSLIQNMGVDMVLNPINISAAGIFEIIQGNKRVISSTLVQGQAEIFEIIADKDMAMLNKSLMDLEIPKDVLIAAIYRNGEVIIPDGKTKLMEGDRIIIFSLLSGIPELEKLLKRK